LVTALEKRDMVVATLCGAKSAEQVTRSVCTMGHKWMWNPKWGGLPPVILDRMKEHGSPVKRIINGGGISQKSTLLNRVYANALNKPVLLLSGDVTSLGFAIFAFLACGELLFRNVYFSFGQPAAPPAKMGHILPTLRDTASPTIAMEIA
jgi:ribulose kinase